MLLVSQKYGLFLVPNGGVFGGGGRRTGVLQGYVTASRTSSSGAGSLKVSVNDISQISRSTCYHNIGLISRYRPTLR